MSLKNKIPPKTRSQKPALQVDQIKTDFPIFDRHFDGHKLVYLDSAATSQKPRSVIEVISNYYQKHNANVHRGVHQLADESTELYEQARAGIARFFGAFDDELILTRNTTEALNLVAYGWADHHLSSNDVILTSSLEHHSNLVVWQEACRRTGAELRFVNLTQHGEIDLDSLAKQLQTLGKRVKLVALSHVSNTLGSLLDIEKVQALTKKVGAKLVIDGAQSAPHLPINFDRLKVDFFAFSGHKLLGPMGSGGLLVSSSLLADNQFRPSLFGGGMIEQVALQQTKFHPKSRERFTAGTPDVASALGLVSACDYLHKLDMKKVAEHDLSLVIYAWEKLKNIKQIELVGPPPPNRVGSVAFVHRQVHAHDVAQVLASQGVAVRSGHHCTMPLHNQFGWNATVRASFGVYNSFDDIDALVKALAKVEKVFN